MRRILQIAQSLTITHECGFTFDAMKEHYLDDLKVGDRCNALLLDQSLPTFIGHNLNQIGEGQLLEGCHLFQFLSLLFTHRDVLPKPLRGDGP